LQPSEPDTEPDDWHCVGATMTHEDKCHILLVDDQPENLIALESVLARLDQHLVKANSCRQALRYVLEQDFAVILLDVRMPGMDGFETATLIRTRERSKHVPIIFLTALGTNEAEMIRGYSLGAVDYLFKPFIPEVLISKVAVFVDLFQMREQVRQQAQDLSTTNQHLEQEIIERKRAEMEIAHLQLLTRQVHLTATRVLDESNTLADATPKLFQAIGECAGWVFGAMWGVDSERHLLRCEEVWHLPSVEASEFAAASRLRTFEPGSGLPGRVWASGEPCWISNVLTDTDFPRNTIAAKAGLHGAMCFPIRLKNEIYGVMEFFSHEIRPPDPPHLKMMAEIGHKIGRFIERRRAEEALQQARESVLESKHATMLQVAASVAHELRNPLGVIRNSAYYLRSKIHGDDKLTRHLEIIDQEIRASDQLIDQLANFHKPIRLSLAPVDVNAEIDDVLSTVIFPPAMAVVRHMSDNVPIAIADKDHLRRVFINLVRNALDAMEEEGELQVRTDICNETVRVSIADTGTGIPPKVLPRIFDPFFTTKAKGIGLGLAISKRIIEHHGGQLVVQSELCHGTTFTMTLPQAKSHIERHGGHHEKE
jgi:signal transduction histidine kinase/DNA-binding response OmpR family regulator